MSSIQVFFFLITCVHFYFSHTAQPAHLMFLSVKLIMHIPSFLPIYPFRSKSSTIILCCLNVLTSVLCMCKCWCISLPVLTDSLHILILNALSLSSSLNGWDKVTGKVINLILYIFHATVLHIHNIYYQFVAWWFRCISYCSDMFWAQLLVIFREPASSLMCAAYVSTYMAEILHMSKYN